MKCFVMMPYGKTESETKEYSRIYKLLIRSAAEECGLVCERSDFEAKGGHIMTNVLEDLVTADIAIADISNANWNVAYELGIRHVLHKNGTVLICNDQTEIPIDLQSRDIFFYPINWLDDMEELCEKLKKRITNRLNGIKTVDSPVHETYTFLPENLIKSHGEATDDALKEAKIRIAELEKELASAYEKFDSLGLSPNSAQTQTIDYCKSFITELDNNIYNSDNAVAKLRELADSGEKKDFFEFLGKVLSVGFLDETDCRIIYNLCNRMSVPANTRMYLEAVTGFYPENEELFGFLANEYSKNYHTGEKAIQMVNGIIGLSRKDGSFQLSKTTRVTSTKLGSFFNVYQHLNKLNEILDIGTLILEHYPDNKKICAMVFRHMTTASIKLDNMIAAKEYKDSLLALAPESDLTHWLCFKYADAVNQHAEAVAELEICISLDRTDIDYYYAMAEVICNDLYAREPATKEIIKISEQDADEYAIPFILAALSSDITQYERAINFIRRNKFNTYLDPIVDALQSGNMDWKNIFPELNFEAVEYCYSIEI
ncbi:MAG: hypothetical protein E7397_05200 [Ruminococcaceae bacterium]|nr:hypothetical protein [Oscillospiraceae bacterium]